MTLNGLAMKVKIYRCEKSWSTKRSPWSLLIVYFPCINDKNVIFYSCKIRFSLKCIKAFFYEKRSGLLRCCFFYIPHKIIKGQANTFNFKILPTFVFGVQVPLKPFLDKNEQLVLIYSFQKANKIRPKDSEKFENS